jgi:hypothetical protein
MLSQINAHDVVRLQVGELRVNVLCADRLEIVQESVQVLAAVPRLSIHTVRKWGLHTEQESIAILDALAPITGSVECCDLSDFR